MDNIIGKKLDGRYLIEELVGSGGMANVYKAKDLKYNRSVAVKILRDEFIDNEDLVRRFKNESKAIAVLDHSSVVKVFDISVTEKLQFIVMEYIDGITLREYMDKRGQPLTYKETLFFVTQTLDALSHAHEKGVVHRDIKPQNIMLIEDGTIRVMDFGIARFSRAQNSSTITDKAIGSVHYISPEQAKGDITDAKSDIYSVGVMMYEMLCGKLPFESENMVSVAIKQISDTAKPLCEVNSEIPKALEAITCRAMAKDPLRRYASAKDMLADIEEFKKNPSVKFEYKYLSDTAPERYIDKIVKKPRQTGTQQPTAQKEKKKRRYGLPILAGMATAFAIGAVVLVFMIFKLSGNPLFNDKIDVDLPDFIGMAYSSVKGNADFKKNFKFAVEEKYNDAEPGTVYDQFPKSGKMVKEGAKITLRVSMGPEMLTIPDVVGKTKEEAQKILKELNLYLSYRTEVTKEVPPGQITKIEPEAGLSVKAGTTVYIYESRTQIPTEAKVPLIQGVTLDEARDLLRKATLAIGTVTKEESELAEGTVISQSPAPDETVKKGTTVNVVVAKPIEARLRMVSVSFNDSIHAASWTASCEGDTSAAFVTENGRSTIWQIWFTNSDIKNVVITSDKGDTHTISVNFTPNGADTSVAIGGSYVPKDIERTITVNFDSTVNAGTFTASIDGAAIASYTTSNGTAATWTFKIKSMKTKTIVISGNGITKEISVDFSETGGNPGAVSIGGTYSPPTPTPDPEVPSSKPESGSSPSSNTDAGATT